MAALRRPSSNQWQFVRIFQQGVVRYSEIYGHASGIVAMSSVDRVEHPVENGRMREEWHLSVSFKGRRASNEQCRQALLDFDLEFSEELEDNHLAKGIARHFWMPVDPAERAGCPCFAKEPAHVEADGYVWREGPAKKGKRHG